MIRNYAILLLVFSTFIFNSCNGCSSQKPDTSYLETEGSEYIEPEVFEPIEEQIENSINVPFKESNGNIIMLPVKINGMGLDMIFDTGASSTCITLAEAQYLYEKGNFTEDDIIDVQQFQTADGSITEGLKIILRNVSIGDQINLYNIEAIVVRNQQAPLLLGQSVMKKFKEISVDRTNGVVKFYE